MTAKRVFLAATGQNRGKTTTSLGLLAAIRDRGLRLGFVKPVGQRYLVVDGTRADEDAVLMSEAFGLPDALERHVAGHAAAALHDRLRHGPGRRRPRGAGRGRLRRASPRTRTSSSSRAPGTPASARWSACRTRASPRCSTRRSSSCPRAASAGRSTRSCSTGRCSPRTACGSSARSSTRSTSSRTRICRRCFERGLAQHGVELLACIPYSAVPGQPVAGADRDAPRRRAARRRGDAGPDDRLGRDRCHAGGPRRRAAARSDPADHPGRSRGPRARRHRGEPRRRACRG